jgi:TolB-like protein/Tfp pilus assembly protein PilF
VYNPRNLYLDRGLDMSEPPASPGNFNTPPPNNEPRLESWGEIALYLGRDIRTVQRWEKQLALPIHRLKTGKQGQVFAFRSELDRWRQNRQLSPGDDPDGPADSSIGNEASKNDGSAPISNALPPRPETPRWKGLALVGGAIILLAAIGLLVYGTTRDKLVTTREPQKAYLFVRPFTSVSEEPKEGQFVVGLTNDLITHLGRLDPERLIVFAPTTSKELGGKTTQELNTTLKADYILEGSARRDGDQLRIDVALISASDQNAKWTKAYTDSVGNVLKFQDDVSDDVSKEIRTAIPSLASPNKRAAAAMKVDPAVYEAYQAGRNHWLDRDIARSFRDYQKALSLDPNYAPALAGLASTYLLMGQSPNDAMPAVDTVPKAREAAQRALAIDPTLADADCVLAYMAMVYDNNLQESERLFKKAIAEDPSNVTAHEWYGYYLMVTNHMPEAEMEINQALQLDPAAPLINSALAEVKYYRRDYDGAIAQAKKTLAQKPGYLYAIFWLGSAYREKEMYTEALEQFKLATQLSGDHPAMLWAYGHALARAGKKEEAKTILAELKAMRESRFIPALYLAGMYCGLGDNEETFRWLDKAHEEKNDRLIYLAVDPLADPLRSDPKFPALMKRVGLP